MRSRLLPGRRNFIQIETGVRARPGGSMDWGGPGPGSALLSGATRLLLGLPTCHWTPRFRGPASARSLTLCPGTNPTPTLPPPPSCVPVPGPGECWPRLPSSGHSSPAPPPFRFRGLAGRRQWAGGAGRLEAPARPFPFAGPPQGLGQLKPPEEEALNQELAGRLGLTRS